MLIQCDEMIYYHGLRNDLYHGGNGTATFLPPTSLTHWA